MKKISLYIIMCIVIGLTSSCTKEKLHDSIFNTTPPQRNEFDTWLLDNYVKEYNIDFKYALDDNESDRSYNLIPADYEKSKKLAKIVKYLWLESYDEIFDKTGKNKDFMRKYAPKMIQLIGSSALNKDGTEVLGTAEGGIKVVLYKVNSIDPTNVPMLNEYYFKTMHHEFGHILQQTKVPPMEFNTITPTGYSSTGWFNRTNEQAWAMGFVSPYASFEPDEDFVEVIANYLTKSDADWQKMLNNNSVATDISGNKILDGAGKPTYYVTDKVKINQKLQLVKSWLANSWDINIDDLRAIIARRSANINTILNQQ